MAAGGSAVAGVGVLQVGTLIEVFWPGGMVEVRSRWQRWMDGAWRRNEACLWDGGCWIRRDQRRGVLSAGVLCAALRSRRALTEQAGLNGALPAEPP
ncbi:hypothetical protein CYMTET_23779 [Cymbomonas tetramitiformis]|uniref:Uncharacterized protein n=1 Tax=Cymbomonas tetramitiformis TaxID=36881 RepID=A0AAE0L0X9_9CHLO|nr:hypothetical protein CYMTET_23779 [Cymbomonas tetramitiformis]